MANFFIDNHIDKKRQVKVRQQQSRPPPIPKFPHSLRRPLCHPLPPPPPPPPHHHHH